jgi:hypothetical protein
MDVASEGADPFEILGLDDESHLKDDRSGLVATSWWRSGQTHVRSFSSTGASFSPLQ